MIRKNPRIRTDPWKLTQKSEYKGTRKSKRFRRRILQLQVMPSMTDNRGKVNNMCPRSNTNHEEGNRAPRHVTLF